MPLSVISSIGGLNQTINPKPKDITVIDVAGPFSTTITGSSPNYVANVSKNITSGNIYCQGSYIIKCSAWLIEGSISNPSSSLGMICDNSNNTYCTSLFYSTNIWFNYNGIQQSNPPYTQYDTTTGNYDGNNNNQTVYDGNKTVKGDYIDFIFPKNILINTYSFIQRQNTLTRTPKNIYILGSTDGNNWTLISQSTNTNVNSNTWINISLKSSSSINPYSYIRMSINSIQSTAGGLWNIAEINISYNVA
jgi:hypothetical protein